MVQDYSPPPASTGIWVVVYAITMTFAALTSALIVRKGSSLDWQSFTLPSILYLNTVLLLGSSVTLEIARRRVATFMGGIAIPGESPARWLYITLVFGLLFVTGQYVAWARLRAEGLYLATNPSSSFFYLLTAAHVLHVLGGAGRVALCDREAQEVPTATEHAGCGVALLAFRGRALGVSAVAALDETLARSRTGDAVSQADLTMQGHSAGLMTGPPRLPFPPKSWRCGCSSLLTR